MEKDLQVYKNNKKGLKRFLASFKYAFSGMRFAFYHEQNLIFMFIMGILAIMLGIILKINYIERLVIVLLIGIILSLEMLNTAIEATVDLHDKEKRSEKGKVAKDCASGAVCI